MENYTENFLNQNRNPYCPRSSWSSGKIKKKKKKAISKAWRIKIFCIYYKMILATSNISIQTRNRVILDVIQCDYMADYRE